MELEKIGDIFGIKEWINRIEKLDDQYQPFVTKVKQFADRYAMNEIVEFAKSYIKAENHS